MKYSISNFVEKYTSSKSLSLAWIWSLPYLKPLPHGYIRVTGSSLCISPTNERRRCNVRSSLIGSAHIQNDPWSHYDNIYDSVTITITIFLIILISSFYYFSDADKNKISIVKNDKIYTYFLLVIFLVCFKNMPFPDLSSYVSIFYRNSVWFHTQRIGIYS